MHDTLLSHAIRRALVWICLATLVCAALPGLIIGLTAKSAQAGLLVVLLLMLVPVLAVLLPFPFRPKVDHLRVAIRPAPHLQSMAAGIGAALGQPAVDVLEANHPSPNVGVIDGSAGRQVLVVTSGAIKALSRSELEGLCSTQLSVKNHRALSRLSCVASWMLLARFSIVVAVFGFSPLVFLLPLVMAFAVWGVPLWFLMPRILWWLRVASDGVCIETTRFPDPLPGALCKVALYNGDHIPVNFVAAFGVTDLAWIAPVSAKNRSATYVGDRKVSESSTELESDLRLLLSAQLVTDVCIHGRPPTFESWRAAAQVTRNAQRELAEGANSVTVGNYVVDLEGLHEPSP